nr:MAG TPA: KilAC domain protein [Caudoviricetes sp.]
MASDMTRRLDDDEKGTREVRTPGGPQAMTVISEAGLYTAILGSRTTAAQAFKRWVTHEVLPEIRRTGSYQARPALTGPELMAAALIEAQRTLDAAQQRAAEAEAELGHAKAKIEADSGKVLFADAVAASHTSILVGDLAKLLRQNGVNVGANRLFARLRDDGYLIRRRGADWNMPTQRSMDAGLFQVKETTVTDPDGHTTVSRTPKVTGKGQRYFLERYLAPEGGQ